MKMSIWNAQQMDPITERELLQNAPRRYYNKPPKAEYTMNTNTRRSGPYEVSTPKLEDATPCWNPE
jgi:hypothetical protein